MIDGALWGSEWAIAGRNVGIVSYRNTLVIT
jgi:hypothetical protein